MSSTTPPSRRPSPTAWSKTPRSSFSAAKAFAKPIRARRRLNSCGTSGSDKAPLCDDIPRGGVRRVTPQRRCRRGRAPLTPPLSAWNLLQHVHLHPPPSPLSPPPHIPHLCPFPH